MLDAHADGERLCRHGKRRRMEHRIGIACRMPDAEEYRVRRDALRFVHYDSRNAPVLSLNTCHLRLKSHCAAASYDFGAQIFHDRTQDVRPDVRPPR